MPAMAVALEAEARARWIRYRKPQAAFEAKYRMYFFAWALIHVLIAGLGMRFAIWVEPQALGSRFRATPQCESSRNGICEDGSNGTAAKCRRGADCFE